MISIRKNVKNIVKILLIISILYALYLYYQLGIAPQLLYETYQDSDTINKTLEEWRQEKVEYVLNDKLPEHISIFAFAMSYYLFFYLSERWILKKNMNLSKKIILIILNIISISGLVGYVYSAKYSMIEREFGISLFQLVLSEVTIWIEIVSSILWITLLKLVTSKEKGVKSLALEKLYVYIRRVFIFIFLIIEIYFAMSVTNNYEKEIYRADIEKEDNTSIYAEEANEYLTKYYQLDQNYIIQAGVPIILIGFAICFIYLRISNKIKEEKDKLNQESYLNKELIVYCSPWITDISPYNTMGILSKKRLVNYNKLSKNFDYIFEDEQYIFVDYRIISNNVIDLTQFENIAYIFEYEAKCEKDCDKSYNEKFIKIIDECEKNKIKFIIVNNTIVDNYSSLRRLVGKDYIISQIKEKYEYAYFENITDWHSALNELDSEFNKRIASIIKKLGENKSSQYINNSLEKLYVSGNYIEKFYTLLKLLEYIIQCEALSYIAENKLYEKDKAFFKLPTLGYWDSINKDEKIEIPKEKQSNISKLIKELEINNSKDITLFTLKHTITEIHNRNLGHGTISYSISKKYNELLLEIAEILIPNFDKKNISLNGLTFIYRGNEEKISFEEYGLEYIYSGINHDEIEYFCFENGETKKICKNSEKAFILNLGEEHIA